MATTGAYVVLVHAKVKPEHIDKFIELFTPLAEYVAANETGTLCYQLCRAATDPNEIIIYERYTTKEYLETVHWQSQPFKDFGAACRAAGIEYDLKTVTQYTETAVGYMHKQ